MTLAEYKEIDQHIRDLRDELERTKADRDNWCRKFVDLNKELGFELCDPCGTIWTHAAKMQKELEEAKQEVIRWRNRYAESMADSVKCDGTTQTGCRQTRQTRPKTHNES